MNQLHNEIDQPQHPIDRLFKRMALVYGAAWDRSLGSAPLADVKTSWGYELSGFASEEGLKAMAWALDNLPARCPNVIEFRELCRRSPLPQLERLEAPKAAPAVVAEQIARQFGLKQAINQHRANDREWAPRIMDRFAKGEKISPTVLAMAKSAMRGMSCA